MAVAVTTVLFLLLKSIEIIIEVHWLSVRWVWNDVYGAESYLQLIHAHTHSHLLVRTLARSLTRLCERYSDESTIDVIEYMQQMTDWQERKWIYDFFYYNDLNLIP